MFGKHFNEAADAVNYLKNTGALVTLGRITCNKKQIQLSIRYVIWKPLFVAISVKSNPPYGRRLDRISAGQEGPQS